MPAAGLRIQRRRRTARTELGAALFILGFGFAAQAPAVPPAAPADPSKAVTSADGVTQEARQASGAATRPTETLDPELFPVAPELEAAVEFWLKIYTGYDNHVVLLHDERHLNVVYAALDFGDLYSTSISEARKQRARRKHLKEAREKYRSILNDLAAGRTSKAYTADQARVAKLFEDIPGGRGKYKSATSRLRTQTCLRNRFAEAIERSGYYMAKMERIFGQRGLPVELTRLPFVESLFQWNARSSAAAGGIWQFVPSTARLYLDMTAEYDERFDPLLAAEAAASLLGKNYEALETWPLALTAYNHGRAGMKRAVRRTGTRDLGTIVQKYRSRTFGFASRNFYAEFVAAYLAYENRDHYFPGTLPRPLLKYDDWQPQHFVSLPALASKANLDVDDLKLLNPALSREVWRGNLFLPKAYSLRLPSGKAGQVATAYAALPDDRRSPRQVGHRYRVRRGDTLSAIASRFGVSVGSLKSANGIRGHLIRSGQSLLIPPSRSGSRARRATQASSGPVPVAKNGRHVVRRGESLSTIAKRYGTDVRTLQSVNRLSSPDRLRVGQSLKIPGPSADGKTATHVVRRGETLASIARRHGTTVSALRRANRIRGDLITPNQVLVIPGG
ncbi:MAG: LysM peptidoglycan-binding domain-containing protein [Acidobacteriota bacterium]